MSALNVKFDGDGHVHLLNSALNKLLTHSQDISIVAQDGELEVNRLLLLMFSPTISSAISELNSFSCSSILFPDFSLSSVRALIDLLVSGSSSSTDLSDQDFRCVLEMAKLLQIQIDDQNVEMVKSKVYTELESNMETKSMNPFETKSLYDFKAQEDGMLPDDGFPGPVQGIGSNFEDDYGDENNVKVEIIEDDGEKSIYLVRCKESWGEFHQDKFVSGGKGHCIFFNEKWMTPNDFERLSGSKAKKYKDSLYVNGKPLKTLIDPQGTRMGTPSAKQKQISNLNKIEGHMNVLGTPVKGKGVQGSISQYFTPKVKQQENNLDEEHNQEEISPSRGDVNVRVNLKGKSRIADIVDSKKRKRQSNDPNCTQIAESKKIQLDIMPEDALSFKGENSSMDIDKGDFWNTSDDGTCTENSLIIDLNYADNCQPPMVSESNAKQIINNVFQEMMDSIQFEKESNRKEASVETSKSNLDDQHFIKPVAKKVTRRYSVAQTFGLRKAFDESNCLSKEKAQELSKDLCLTENQVKHWFKKSRAKKRAVTYKPEDNLKVKAEIVDKIEHHLEENEMMSSDEKVHKIQSESKNLFEAYSNIEYQCTCECGVTFKNAKLLMFHKHICPKTSEPNAAAKGVPMNSKGESSNLDVYNDETGVLTNGFPSDGKKDQCTCTCGGTFDNAFLLNFHKHVCPITVTKGGI